MVTENSGNPFPAAIIVYAGTPFDLKQHLDIPQGDTPTYILTANSDELGSGLALDSDGILTNTGEAAARFDLQIEFDPALIVDLIVRTPLVDSLSVTVEEEQSQPPVITLTDELTLTHPHGQPYIEPGYTAIDPEDNDVSNDVVISGSVNVNQVGQYILSYDVTDSDGVSAETVFRTVNVTDQAAPIITLVGSAALNHTLGLTFSDPGATATDAVDGDLTDNIVASGTVDINTSGTYPITYNVSDAAGNAATEVTRTVTVTLDGEAPVITLSGGAVTLNFGEAYSEPGFSALDNVDGDLTSQVVVNNPVNSNQAGFYVVTYNVTDAAGNAAVERNRLVTVNASIDGTAPEITLFGDNPYDLSVGETYIEPGFSATDNLDGIITGDVTVSGAVDNTTAGSYSLVYSVTDAAGNTGQAIRQVIVSAVALDVVTPWSRTSFIRPGSEEVQTFVQDSSDRMDYAIDFSAKLQGDPIVNVVTTAEKVSADSVQFNSDRVQFWVQGGKEGDEGLVTVRATSSRGRVIERSVKVRIGEY